MAAHSHRARLHEVDETLDAIEECFRHGWTDGLPVVPPTLERVEAMLNYVSLPPEQVLGEVPVRRRALTAEHAAANAVMAGCLPEYFPVVLATMDAMFRHDPNCIHEASAATNSPGILILVNGPIRQEIGLNCTGNLFSPGHRANATIGRAIRLILINVFEQRPNVLDRGCMGSLTKFGVCVGEDEEQSPWGAVPRFAGIRRRAVHRHSGDDSRPGDAGQPLRRYRREPDGRHRRRHGEPRVGHLPQRRAVVLGGGATGTPKCWAAKAGADGKSRNTSTKIRGAPARR